MKIKRVIFLFVAVLLAMLFAEIVDAAPLPQIDDLPEHIDYRCKDPSYTDFVEKIPDTDGTKYSVDLPEDVVACDVTFYVGSAMAAHMGALSLVECQNGYCTEGLGTYKAYTNGQARFWWTSSGLFEKLSVEKPDRVRMYFRRKLPGETVPYITATPSAPVVTPKPDYTPTPTSVVGPAPHPKPHRAFLPSIFQFFVNLLGR